MIGVALIIIVISVVFIFAGKKNKFVSIITSLLVCIALAVMIGTVYLSKVSTYSYHFGMDYDIYLMLYRLGMPLRKLAKIFSLSISAYLVIQVIYIYKILKRNRAWSLILLIFPIMFAAWTDYRVVYYFKVVPNNWNASVLERFLMQNGNNVMNFIYISMLIIPHVIILYCAIKSKIFSRRRDLLITGFCTAVINGIMLAIFKFGLFKMIWFSNVDAAMIPRVNIYSRSDYFVLILLVALTILISAVLIVFKPFNAFAIIKKREFLQNSKYISNNVSMVLHVYKNAFFAVMQQLNLIKINSVNGKVDAVLKNADDGISIAGDYVEMLERFLKMLRTLKGEYTKTDISKLILKATEGIPEEIEVITKVDDKLYVLGDGDQLTEVFNNLFINGCDAMRDLKRKPVMEIFTVREEDICMICVRDNGKGVPKKQLKKIFNIFYSSKSAAKGGGIGLYYAKSVIEQHDGKIRVLSRLGEYAEFQIVLPIYREKF